MNFRQYMYAYNVCILGHWNSHPDITFSDFIHRFHDNERMNQETKYILLGYLTYPFIWI